MRQSTKCPKGHAQSSELYVLCEKCNRPLVAPGWLYTSALAILVLTIAAGFSAVKWGSYLPVFFIYSWILLTALLTLIFRNDSSALSKAIYFTALSFPIGWAIIESLQGKGINGLFASAGIWHCDFSL
jgi:hypothetical protein